MKVFAATIIKAQGLKGEVKMTSSLGCPVLLKLKTIFIEEIEKQVLSIRTDGRFLYAKIQGISDRNQAETLINKKVFVNRDDLVLPENTFLVDEILGCTLLVNDEEIGRIVDVYQNGVASDVFVVLTKSGKKISFPFLKILSPNIDLKTSTMTVDKTIWEQVSFYED